MDLSIDLQSVALERIKNAVDFRGPEDDSFVRASGNDTQAITSETEPAHSLDPDNIVEADLQSRNETRQKAAGFTPARTKREACGLYQEPRKGPRDVAACLSKHPTHPADEPLLGLNVCRHHQPTAALMCCLAPACAWPCAPVKRDGIVIASGFLRNPDLYLKHLLR